MYTQNINLSIIPTGVRPVIPCSQYDNHLTALRFTLYKDNAPFTVPSGAAVLINGYKPDNTGFSYAAAGINGQTVTFNVTQQMTAVAGDVLCELRIRNQNNEIIGSLNFILRVEPAPLQNDSVLSETEIPLIEQAVDIAANLAQYIQATYTNAAAAQTSANAAAASASNAATSASSAASDAASVQNLYNSIETAKQNANTAAAAAQAAADNLTNITAAANTLQEGSAATASYDASVQRFTFGIPRGERGESGIQTQISGLFAMSVDADGNLWAHCNNNELTAANFRYESDTGNLYYVIPEGA